VRAKARHILTAHTLDDQAETVLFRLARGSGLAGLGGMARVSPLPLLTPLPASGERRIRLVRPFIDTPKARLIATLAAARIPFAEDPSNRDPRFARTRLRALTPALAAEGLTPARLAQLARRVKRANDAIEAAVDQLAAELAPATDVDAALKGAAAPSVELSVIEWAKAPAEIRLRLLGRLIALLGDEGDVELGKLESCEQAAMKHLQKRPAERFRRTLAGAAITLAGDRLIVSRAPPRRAGGRRKGEEATRAPRSAQPLQPKRQAPTK
jgi:tRNA(Ile)-lysidine synthase